MNHENRLIAALRDDLKLPVTITDVEVLDKTANTFTRARVEFGLALSDLRVEIKKAFHFQSV